MGKKVSRHVCVFVLNLCVLAGAGAAEVRALREELIRISISRLFGQHYPNVVNVTMMTVSSQQ